MSYGFIFGAAGTGKTTYLYQHLTKEALLHQEKRYFLFVPEQNTLRAQQELIAASSRHGMLNLDVLSFQLLAYRVLDELGIYKPDILDEMSKSMLLRASCRTVAEELQVYRKKIDQAGFIAQLKSALSEFYQYNITPEKLCALSEQAKETNQLLSGKLSDLSKIFAAFRDKLDSKTTVAEEIPILLLKHLQRSALLDGAELYFDGYTGFTPVQLDIIGGLMSKAEKLCFAVTIPREAAPYRREASPAAVSDLFWLSKETVAKVSELGERNGLRRDEDRFFEKILHEPQLSVSLVRDPKEEVRLLTDRIRSLCRVPQREAKEMLEGTASETSAGPNRAHFRYRDIAVAVSDLASYRELLKDACTEAEIPYFMDDPADGRRSALAELVRAALGVLSEGYSYEAVLSYLRSPLVQTDRELTDLCDNYIRARGFRSRKAYEEVWERSCRGMETLDLRPIEAYKRAKLAPLFDLQDRMRGSGKTAAERLSVLRQYLEDCGAAERLTAFCARLSAEGFAAEAEENRRFYELVLNLFLRMESVLGAEKLTFPEFTGVLEAGFSELRAGMLPQVIDRVVIGDLKRSRFDGISALFILGVNDGLIPSVVSGGGIFTDMERQEILQSNEAELAPADRTDSCIQRFYLYLAMRKPSRALYLSFCKNDMQGKRLKPSVILADLKAQEAAHGRRLLIAEETAETIHSEEEALLYLAEAFSEGKYEDPQVLTVWQYLKKANERQAPLSGRPSDGTERSAGPDESQEMMRTERTAPAGAAAGITAETGAAEIGQPERKISPADRLLAASLFHHEGGRLPEETARRLYGEVLYGSVTRLEQFAKCPFAHFLRYGLRLGERQQYELAALDLGNLYHNALDFAFRRLSADGRELTALSEEELRQLSEESVEEAAAEYNNQIMQSSARSRYLCGRVRRVTDRTLWALRNQLKKGDFRLYGCELPFRYDAENLSLHGRIDRVDVCEMDSRVYVKVIDYKSGRTKFDLSLIYDGMQLQLVTYMNIALKKARAAFPGKEAAPAGMYYYHIDDPVAEYADGLALKQGVTLAAAGSVAERADTVQAVGQPELARRADVQDNAVQGTNAAVSAVDPAAVSEALLRQLRMNGLSSSAPEALRHLDRALMEAGSGESTVVPLKLKDGAVQPRSSKTEDEAGFLALGERVSRNMQEMTDEILSGEIAAKPYRSAQGSSCDYCPYHSVCGFDRRLPGFSYRTAGK